MRSRWRTLIRRGRAPFTRDQCIAKFRARADGVIAPDVQDWFLAAVTRLPDLDAGGLSALVLPGIEQADEQPGTWGSV
jgi:2-methylcitrate dehydratase